MALLTDYFAAEASELQDLNLLVGPAGGPVPADPPKRRLFGRKQARQPGAAEVARSFDTVQTTGLEPTVTMATLEGLMTGADSMEITDSTDLTPAMEADPQQGPWVFRLRPQLQAALAGHDGALDDLAGRWAQTEELEGAQPHELELFLRDLVALARRANERNAELFCWVSL